MTDGLKVSPYLEAGAPTRCFLPRCRRAFDGAAIHGEDGRYYCSTNCADTGRTVLLLCPRHNRSFQSADANPSLGVRITSAAEKESALLLRTGRA